MKIMIIFGQIIIVTMTFNNNILILKTSASSVSEVTGEDFGLKESFGRYTYSFTLKFIRG